MSLLPGGFWLEVRTQGHLWMAPHIVAEATWFQKPEHQNLGRRWNHLQSAVEKGA